MYSRSYYPCGWVYPNVGQEGDIVNAGWGGMEGSNRAPLQILSQNQSDQNK